MATTRYVFPGVVPAGSPTPNYSTIAAAMSAAVSGDTIEITAGNYNEPLTITKAGITVNGSVDVNNVPTVSIRGNNNYSNTITNLSNITVKNILVKKPSSTNATTYFMTHISGTAGLASNILFENVHYDSSELPTRGVSVNVANVTFKQCVFPKTANFSLGIASSRGVICENCTFKQSGWGTIGIFPTNQTITNQINTSKETQNIDLRVGNSFVNELGNGPADMGLIHIQPYSGANYGGPIIAGLDSSATVKLPAAFKYLYYNTAPHAGTVTEPGVVSMTAVNTRTYFGLVDVQTALNAVTPNSVSAIYGKDLLSGDILVESGLSIPTAMSVVLEGQTIDIAAGSYGLTADLYIEKAITLKGAGKAATTLQFSNAGHSLNIKKSGVVVRDLKIANSASSNEFICHITRESALIDTANVSLINVAFQSVTRGVAANGVSNVTFTNCDFPQTANYSVGLASVRGCVMSGCSIPASAWGSIGIFPSSANAYGATAISDGYATTGIDLSNNTFTGPSGSGIIQVQPGIGPAITYGFAAENVKLPAAFIYAYVQQTRSAAGADLGVPPNYTISNVRFLDTAGPVTTVGSGAYYYAALQAATSAATSGGRLAIYGRNLSTDAVFFDAPFDAVDKAYGGLAVADLIVIAPESTVGEVASLTAAAVQAIVDSPSKTDSAVMAASITQQLASAKATAAAAPTAPAASAPKIAIVELIKAANEAAYPATGSANFAIKTGLARAIDADATFNITLSSTDRDAILGTIPDNKKAEDAASKEMVLRVPVGNFLKLPSAPENKNYYFPAMENGKDYTLLLDTESAVPAGAADSQVKFDNGSLYFRASSSASYAQVNPGDNLSLVRNGITYSYPISVVGTVAVGGGSVPCIPAGQRVLTVAGWRAVEDLRNGDMLVTDAGAAVPAKIYSTTLITSEKTAPISIPASMFGKTGAPVRLSPLHAVRLTKGIWEFPYNLLRSRAGVTQDAPGQKITYYHIALPNFFRDNLVLEGGVVAESYGAPFIKAHGLQGVRLYTYNERLGGYTRMAPAAASKKT